MSLFRRIKNIVRSHINYGKTKKYMGIDACEDMDYNDREPVVDSGLDLERSYYRILELEYGADFDAIKRAYRKLLKKYHPDLFQKRPEKLGAAQEVTRRIMSKKRCSSCKREERAS